CTCRCRAMAASFTYPSTMETPARARRCVSIQRSSIGSMRSWPQSITGMHALGSNRRRGAPKTCLSRTRSAIGSHSPVAFRASQTVPEVSGYRPGDITISHSLATYRNSSESHRPYANIRHASPRSPMINARIVLLIVLAAMSLLFAARWIRALTARRLRGDGSSGPHGPGFAHVAVGSVTNFFDTLGIGSFATTTTAYKMLRLVPDERIPGTMIVGHALPATAQALIF